MNRLLLSLLLAASASALSAQISREPETQQPPPTPEQLKAAAAMPFRDPSLPIEQRVNDLVSRLTLEEKVAQTHGPRHRDPAPRHPRVQLVERRPARHRALRLCDHVSPGHRQRGHVGCAAAGAHRRRRFHRGPRQVQRRHSPQHARPLLRPHHLVAQHQHLPRPALGPRPGDLRRGPVPDRPPRHCVRQGHPGRRPALPARHGHAQALRRAQRPRVHAPRSRRRSHGARPVGHLPARVSRHHYRGPGGLHHVFLQCRR